MTTLVSEPVGTPAISVLMTVYNTARYLSEAIDSVLLQQSQWSWELLIVDDGSNDRSLEIARAYAAQHPGSIRVFQHDDSANHGISASRNLALQHARGRYIAFLDSDDIWLPHHLDTLAGALEEHTEAAMVYGAAERWVDHRLPFDDVAARAARWGLNYLPPLTPTRAKSQMLPIGELVRWFQTDESLVPCICSVMVRAEAARAVGGFREEFRGLYDDQVFHAKMSQRFLIFALDVCVARYRQHESSCCATALRLPEVRIREHKLFETYLAEAGLPRALVPSADCEG